MTSFAQLLEGYFRETAQTHETQSHHFEIAGHPLRLELVRKPWSTEMTAALSHLAVKSPAPEAAFTVALWDGEFEPRHHLLRAYLFALTNWWFSYTGPRGELLDLHSGQLTATYHPGTQTLSVVDFKRRRAYYWKRDAARNPYYEVCSPFRSLLHSWMRSRERYFVHGAAVGDQNGGVLLVGKGGSGKSTSALSCLQAGMRYVGDDYCILAENAGEYEVHSLYCTAKLVEEKNLDSFPGLQDKVVNPRREPGEKVAISLAGDQVAGLTDRLPLRAILVPVITGRPDTAIVPCPAREAMLAIAPSTLAQLPASGKRDLEFLGNLARRVPCYRLLLGATLAQVPEKIAELLSELAPPPGALRDAG